MRASTVPLKICFEDGIDPQASNAQSFFLQDKYTRNNFWDNCSIPRKTWRHSVSTTILCHSASTAWFPDSAAAAYKTFPVAIAHLYSVPRGGTHDTTQPRHGDASNTEMWRMSQENVRKNTDFKLHATSRELHAREVRMKLREVLKLCFHCKTHTKTTLHNFTPHA